MKKACVLPNPSRVSPTPAVAVASKSKLPKLLKHETRPSVRISLLIKATGSFLLLASLTAAQRASEFLLATSNISPGDGCSAQ